MWAARDKTNKLHLFTVKPYKKMEECDTYAWHPDCRAYKICIDSSLFPDLKWEDEPIEVELKAIPKAKPISQLWEEWRFTNEWKANCQYTTFDQFLIDRGIKYTVE